MTIVVGYVPTPQGEAALDRAILEAGRDGGHKLIVVNASKSDPIEDDRAIADSRTLKRIEDRLESSVADFEVRQALRGQDPAGEIVDTAERSDATLIVIGLRKRSSVGKMLFGSTARGVLMDAQCPVLTVKAPKSR
ncbi:universal stress protein [Brevibacterium atlanticum]|uniref:universal stress protein n=1 Tax=Brevibacterium atlanticum TaxID=2697563 RepID=UPI001422ABC0|nr:universal stress protein [Brevibacterium atlanticum]